MKPLGALGVLVCVVVISRSALASYTRISYIVGWHGTAVYAFLQSDPGCDCVPLENASIECEMVCSYASGVSTHYIEWCLGEFGRVGPKIF